MLSRLWVVSQDLKARKDSQVKGKEDSSNNNSSMADHTPRRPYPSSRAQASRLRALVRARVCAGVRLAG